MEHLLGWMTLGLGLLLIWRLTRAFPEATRPLLAAFLFRALLAVIHAYLTPLPDSLGDALNFERKGWVWSLAGLRGIPGNFTAGAYLYSWIISVLYVLTAPSPLMIQALNVLLGTLIVLNGYRLAGLLWGARSAVAAAWLVALFPTAALYSALTLREVAMVYPLTLGMVHLVAWIRTAAPRDLVLAGAACCAGALFHPAAVVAVGVVALAAAIRWLAALASRRRQAAGATAAMLIAILVLAAVLTSGWGVRTKMSREGLTLPWLAKIQVQAARDRTAYLPKVIVGRPADLLWQGPLRAAFFLFAPFPWMVTELQDLLGLFDASLYLALVVAMVLAWRRLKADAAAVLVLLVFTGLVGVFALSTSNYGTAIRHRAKLAPLAVSLAVAAAPALRWPSGRSRPGTCQRDPAGTPPA